MNIQKRLQRIEAEARRRNPLTGTMRVLLPPGWGGIVGPQQAFEFPLAPGYEGREETLSVRKMTL